MKPRTGATDPSERHSTPTDTASPALTAKPSSVFVSTKLDGSGPLAHNSARPGLEARTSPATLSRHSGSSSSQAAAAAVAASSAARSAIRLARPPSAAHITNSTSAVSAGTKITNSSEALPRDSLCRIRLRRSGLRRPQ
ncbi:MAG: hypothetical protein OXE79_00980 [Acidimicrobiaceae bacterium]|nr:hypothetical protein [Acidimicrobiaceae bacterium]